MKCKIIVEQEVNIRIDSPPKTKKKLVCLINKKVIKDFNECYASWGSDISWEKGKVKFKKFVKNKRRKKEEL